MNGCLQMVQVDQRSAGLTQRPPDFWRQHKGSTEHRQLKELSMGTPFPASMPLALSSDTNELMGTQLNEESGCVLYSCNKVAVIFGYPPDL